MFGKFKAEQVNPWFGAISTERPIYKPFFNGEELATEEQLNELNKKLDLILDHLKLVYVPETEKIQPAKLVERIEGKIIDASFFGRYLTGNEIDVMYQEVNKPNKKKPGRPKKK